MGDQQTPILHKILMNEQLKACTKLAKLTIWTTQCDKQASKALAIASLVL